MRRFLPLSLLLPLMVHGFCSTPLSAQTAAVPTSAGTQEGGSSSSVRDSLPEAPARARLPKQDVQDLRRDVRQEAKVRPFGALATSFKVGIAGIGFEFATPLAARMNLRAGMQLFEHSLNPNADGIHSVGELSLQNTFAAVDLFPFRHSSFHLSPGATVLNDNHLRSNLSVPGGQRFSLGGTSYLSDPNAPITGLSRIKFGSQVAPRLTAGWGNMLARSGSHFSMPFEIGLQYISIPTIELDLNGSACDNAGNCGDINAAGGPQAVQQEIQRLNQDISSLRFYPIVATGLSYRFGGSHAGTH